MRAIRLLLVLSAITIANLIQAQYKLTVDIQDMNNYIGKQMIVRVTETPSGKEVGRRVIDPIDTADFSFDLYVLLNQRSYHVDFYVDVNASGDFDPLPTDHAWQRTLNNVTQNTTLTFIADMNFANISMPSAFPYSTYDATWGGRWMNLTFGSTDSIEAGFTVRCDSIFGFFKTKGVFGNPAPVEFNYANAVPPDSSVGDTILFSLDPPWTGEVYTINGELHGTLSLMGVGLEFTGTVGTKQVLALYTVIVSGNPFANGYFYVRELNVNNSTPELEIELAENAEVSCHNGNDGFLSTNAIGGTPDYSYQWSIGDTTAQILNLIAGDYSLTVTDANGCNTDVIYSVSQPSQIVISAMVENPICNGICNGEIDITVHGGIPGYDYSWSNGTVFEDQFGICGGDWGVIVTDANGCTSTLEVFILEPESFGADIYTTPASCSSACDGSIELDVYGGTPPYNFHNYTDLCEGFYQIFVTDANGCLLQLDVFVNSLPGGPSIINIVTIDVLNGQSDGSIVVTATGFYPPFVYSLNNGPYQASNIFTGLPAGNYLISVKDSLGCIDESNVVINNITAVNELQAKFEIYPNPASTYLHADADVPISIDVLDLQGHMIKNDGKSLSHQIPLEGIMPGLYVLRISDGFGVAYRRVIVE